MTNNIDPVEAAQLWYDGQFSALYKFVCNKRILNERHRENCLEEVGDCLRNIARRPEQYEQIDKDELYALRDYLLVWKRADTVVGITKEQQQAVLKLYNRNADEAQSFLEFRRRVRPAPDYVYVEWCGMYVGIEKDGYTHT